MDFRLGTSAARRQPRAGRSDVAAAVRSVLCCECPEPRLVAQCTAAGGCVGNGGSRRHAQELRRDATGAVRDGRSDSDRRLREHRELAARTRDREAARNGCAHEPRCGALDRHPATADRELAARVDRRTRRRRAVDCGYASPRAAPDGWERRVTPCAAELVGPGAHARGHALDRRGVRPCPSRSCNEGRDFSRAQGIPFRIGHRSAQGPSSDRVRSSARRRANRAVVGVGDRSEPFRGRR